MNIIIKTYQNGSLYCRPDTTWERENRDFYSPECVNSILWTPAVFARVSKAGKAVGKKFASRYYDALNFGAFLYIGDKMPEIAAASCADHTSILPFPLYNKVVFENKDNRLTISNNEEAIFTTDTEGMIEKIEAALCECTMLTSVRIGDIIATELDAPKILCSRDEANNTTLEAEFCGNQLFGFNLLF